MHLGDLPIEIQNYVLQSCSPADLAVLSRTHTSLRDAAEYVLYGHIQICLWYNRVPGVTKILQEKTPLRTLVTNSRKASIVKALYLDCNSVPENLLAEALEKMTALVDLCIRYGETTDQCERISRVIRGGYFKLNSLCLGSAHDIEGIIAGQPHLRLYGIFYQDGGPNTHLWEMFERFSQTTSRHHTVPTFFMLDCHGDCGAKLPVTYTLLPSLYHPGEVSQVCQETATLIKKWPFLRENYGYQLCISLLGISEKNMYLVEKTMVAMMACLPDYHDLHDEFANVRVQAIIHAKYIQKPWRFSAFLEPIIHFKRLSFLYFDFVDLDEDRELGQMAHDLESCLLAKGLAWGHTKWPNLQGITLYDKRSTSNLPPSAVLVPRHSRWYA
ncbi:hypothetical protein F5887DRAFT_999910 [Amanita rubescens]|nr:hypothetical protein F5887DRAFT_999910 [Amanita rubescens]